MDSAGLMLERLREIRYGALPISTVEAAKKNIMDTLAVALAGVNADGCGTLVDLYRHWGGRQEASILLHGSKIPAHCAAFVNATMAHALDWDDTHDGVALHAGVAVVPTALAVAEMVGKVSGQRLIEAVVAGIETSCRMGRACHDAPGTSGYIYTALFGTFSATVTAGRLLGLDDAQMLNAIGIAYSNASGNMQVSREGSGSKKMQPGLMAQAGVLSAVLAARGVTGPQEPFDGIYGLFPVYLQGRYDRDELFKDFTDGYEIEILGYKPYPSCRWTHSSIDCALALRGRVQPEAIDRIDVHTSSQAFHVVYEPVDTKKRPQTSAHGQFSIPFTVASALRFGAVVPETFREAALRDRDTLDLASRVYCHIDEALERELGRGTCPSRTEVRLKSGEVVSHLVTIPRGHPDNPLQIADVRAKAEHTRAAWGGLVDQSRVESALGLIERLEEVLQVETIVSLLS